MLRCYYFFKDVVIIPHINTTTPPPPPHSIYPTTKHHNTLLPYKTGSSPPDNNPTNSTPYTEKSTYCCFTLTHDVSQEGPPILAEKHFSQMRICATEYRQLLFSLKQHTTLIIITIEKQTFQFRFS